MLIERTQLALVSCILAIGLFAGCETASVDLSDNTNDNTSNNTNTNEGGNDNTPGFTREPQEFSITPDDFADGTDMTEIEPHVVLSVADTDNTPFDLFQVTVTEDGQNYAPSGTMVFAHENIPFFNDVRRLRMDFQDHAREITISFAGGTGAGGTEIGRLEAYDDDGNLLDEYVTEPKLAGEVEVMTITRDEADIAYVIGYVADGEGSFGRFDDLSYTVDVAVTSKSK